jgi:putative IMPACT (imprinted ancient) family translation regulator
MVGKLGTGGLVHAYSHGAVAAIEAAGIVERKLHQQLLLNFDYHHFGKLEYELRTTPYLLDTVLYGEKITWPIWVPVGEVTELLKRLADWTGDR